MLQSINPYNQEVIQSYQEYSQRELNNIIAEADSEFTKWKTYSYFILKTVQAVLSAETGIGYQTVCENT